MGIFLYINLCSHPIVWVGEYIVKKISIKTKSCNKTFDEGFEQFIIEHIRLKNLRASTEKHYREIVKYSFYKYSDKKHY